MRSEQIKYRFHGKSLFFHQMSPYLENKVIFFDMYSKIYIIKLQALF